MRIYKPNSKNTGYAGSFSVTSSAATKGQGIYLEIIKQKTWDDSSKTGTFDSSKENKINLKFSNAEVAEMIMICQRQKGQAKFYHKTPDSTAQISFGPYPNPPVGNEPAKGIGLSVSKDGKRGALPLTFPEAYLLSEWLKWALTHIFNGDYAEYKKAFKTPDESKLD